MTDERVREIYEDHYASYCISTCGDSKYEWAASEVFDLTTYDGELDELFVKKIIEVIKVIFTRTSFEYIKDQNNYITYILVCQLLEKFNWIEWGTSIRGAWFESYHPNQKTHPILDFEYEQDRYGCKEIPFSDDNLIILIRFLEEAEE